jgi:hypothetical protein
MPGLILSFDPDMITFDDSMEARALMTCGHVISTESMTQFLRSLVSNKKYKIVCPGYNLNGTECKTEWDYKVCRQVGVLTSEENKEFEKGFEENLFSEFLCGKECPFCRSLVIKPASVTGNRVHCVMCNKGDFCWKCLGKWQGSLNKCGNLGCMEKKEANYLLATCPVITIDGFANVPDVRVCPRCESLIQLTKGCRHMSCKSS